MSDWCFEGMPEEPAPAPARRASRAWPPCGARTRTGRPCVAPGAGVGGRCPNHGGVPHSGPFALLPGEDWRERDAEAGAPRAWSARIVPTKVWRSVTMDGALDFDGAYPVRIGGRWHGDLRRVDERDGRHVVKLWPQLIGLRVARRLMERGRITHAVVPDTRAARKLRTLRPPEWTDVRWEAWLEQHIVLAEAQP